MSKICNINFWIGNDPSESQMKMLPVYEVSTIAHLCPKISDFWYMQILYLISNWGKDFMSEVSVLFCQKYILFTSSWCWATPIIQILHKNLISKDWTTGGSSKNYFSHFGNALKGIHSLTHSALEPTPTLMMTIMTIMIMMMAMASDNCDERKSKNQC